jgi:TP901 family phage tail tape measure protein
MAEKITIDIVLNETATKGLAEIAKSLESIGKAASNSLSSIKDLDRFLNALSKEASQIAKLDNSFSKLDKGATDSSKAVKSLETNIKKVSATNSGIKTLSTSFKNVGDGARSILDSVFNLKTALVGIGAGLAIKDAVTTFANFDDTMRRVGVTSGATGAKYKELENAAKTLGETTRFSASESAEALQFLTQAGFSADQALVALPDTLNLASAGALELADAADIATNVLSGFRLPVEELTRVNDVLVKTASSANTNVQQLGDAFKVAAPAATAAGISIEETSAVLGGLSNNGIQASEAGNAFKRIILELQTATPRTTAELKRLGVEVKNQDGTYRSIIPVLQDLATKNIDLVSAEKLFGRETAAAGVAAIGASKDISTLLGDLKALEKDGFSFTTNAAKKMEEGVGGSIREMRSAFEALKIAVVQDLEGEISQAIDFITENLRALKDQIKEFQETGSIGPLFDQAIASAQQLIEVIKSVVSVLGTIQSGFGTDGILDGISFVAASIEKLPLFFQEAFAQIDLIISKSRETILELQQAWAQGLFGSEEQEAAVQALIDAENQRQEAIKLTIDQIKQEKVAIDENKIASLNASKAIISEKQKERDVNKLLAEEEKTLAIAARQTNLDNFKQVEQEKITVAQEASQKRIEAQEKATTQINEILSKEGITLKDNYTKRINEIERLEALNVLTHEKAQKQKEQAELMFLQRSLAAHKEYMASIDQTTEAGVKEYVQATQKKLDIENKIYSAITNTIKSVENTTTAIQDTAQAAGVAAAAFDDMAISAENVNQATRGTNKTVLSYSQAMSKSMSQIDALGVRSAASLLGVTQEYENLIRTVKKLGGETEGLYETSINDIKEYISELRKASTQTINTQFTGSGSPTKPLSEKIKDMQNLIGNFINSAGDANVNTNFSQISAMNSQTAANISPSSMLDGVKDLGKTDLVVGGKAYPVMGESNVIKQLQNQLQRESRMVA